MEFYLNLSKEGLKKTEKEASKEAKETFEGKESEDSLIYSEPKFVQDELYFDTGSDSIVLNGELFSNKIKLGYISVDMPLNTDIIIEIIEHYRKKLAKIKTILEAVK